jgi:transposase
MCEARIRASKTKAFPFWIKVPLSPYVPAKAHRGLNRALRAGGKLTTCEVKMSESGEYFAIVFVRFDVEKGVKSENYLGCDVGVNAGVARSDGYVGKSLRPILLRTRQKRAEQQRQGHCKSSARSSIKQFLDREAKRTVASARRGNQTLVLEARRQLGNLKPTGSIGGWARRHFGERVRQIAEISSVAVVEVNAAYTSTICLRCRHSDRRNRRGVVFRCSRCDARGHADFVAAVNLVRRATGAFRRDKAGIKI